MNHRISITAVLVGLMLAPVAWGQEKAPAAKPGATAGAAANSADTYRLLNLFGDVFEQVRSDYVESPSDEELIEAAITGMLASLDPHSSYLNSKNFRDMQTQTRGSFGGLGLEVTMERGLVKVVSPIDDTPASRAGVKPGDFITHLNGEQVMGLTLNDAVEKMRGPVGTDIKLTLRREGREAFDVTLTRAVVKLQSVRSRLEGSVGYVRITSFTEQTEQGLQRAVAQLEKDHGKALRGFVLDLRNNPGGLLNQAVAVSDAFLEKGEIVSTRSRQAEDTERYNANPGDLAKGLPIVVLVNGGSASASEIVAGALQDHRRAIVMGTTTFGKGSVQTIRPIPGHGAVRLTTARYFTPSGRSIQAKGIEPDLVVEQGHLESADQQARRRESDLRGALSNPDGPAVTPPARGNRPPVDESGGEAASGKPAAEEEDYQLARALDLLKGIALYSNRTPE